MADMFKTLNNLSVAYARIYMFYFIMTLCSLFSDPKRNLELPNSVVREALMLFQDNDEITFLATVKQETGDSGAIFSFSSGLHR